MDFTKLCSQLQKRASYKGEAEQTKRSGQKLTWKTKVDNEVVVGGCGGREGRGFETNPSFCFETNFFLFQKPSQTVL